MIDKRMAGRRTSEFSAKVIPGGDLAAADRIVNVNTAEELANSLGLEPMATVASWRVRAIQEKVERYLAAKRRGKMNTII
jgi:hypothetical protein